MLKDLNGQVVPHPTEYIVMVGEEVTPITMKVGDKLWFVPHNRRGDEYTQGKEIVITRVGRDYAYSQEQWVEYKIKKENNVAYNRRGDSEGLVYLNEPAYKLELLRRAEWKRFQQAVSRAGTAPDDVTLLEILQLQVILKMRKEVPAPRPSRAERAYGEQQFFHD
jgi:hypothetical protein